MVRCQSLNSGLVVEVGEGFAESFAGAVKAELDGFGGGIGDFSNLLMT